MPSLNLPKPFEMCDRRGHACYAIVAARNQKLLAAQYTLDNQSESSPHPIGHEVDWIAHGRHVTDTVSALAHSERQV